MANWTGTTVVNSYPILTTSTNADSFQLPTTNAANTTTEYTYVPTISRPSTGQIYPRNVT